MHEIASAYLGELASRVTFVTRDFREKRMHPTMTAATPTWPNDLGTFDAVDTLQGRGGA